MPVFKTLYLFVEAQRSNKFCSVTATWKKVLPNRSEQTAAFVGATVGETGAHSYMHIMLLTVATAIVDDNLAHVSQENANFLIS